jgi:CRISPR-associated protein Cmr3
MSKRTFRFTPIDTLFFRDSRPFDSGPLQSIAETLFPPPGRTLVGAVRLALARGRGYDGRGQWSPALAETLGDGPHNLGKLQFQGPHLALDGEPLYALPLHVAGARCHDEASHLELFRPETRFAPGPAVRCDLGSARLPVPVKAEAALGSGAGFFVRKEGIEAVLAGDLPAECAVVSPGALYTIEARIGLERDADRRTAKRGLLYSSTHLRLRDRVSMIIEAQGVPDAWAAACPRLVALGGESRMADLEVTDPLPTLNAPLDVIRDSRRLTVTLLTPLRLRRETMPRPGEVLDGVPGIRVVSACLGKPVLLGGWDSVKREPLPLCPYLPAGSTWFCTVDPAHEDAVSALHGACMDAAEGALGFGAVALGTWNEMANE